VQGVRLVAEQPVGDAVSHQPVAAEQLALGFAIAVDGASQEAVIAGDCRGKSWSHRRPLSRSADVPAAGLFDFTEAQARGRVFEPSGLAYLVRGARRSTQLACPGSPRWLRRTDSNTSSKPSR